MQIRPFFASIFATFLRLAVLTVSIIRAEPTATFIVTKVADSVDIGGCRLTDYS